MPQCLLPRLLAVPVAVGRHAAAAVIPTGSPCPSLPYALPRLAVPCQPGSVGELTGASFACLPATSSYQASCPQALVGHGMQLPAHPPCALAAVAVVRRLAGMLGMPPRAHLCNAAAFAWGSSMLADLYSPAPLSPAASAGSNTLLTALSTAVGH